MTQERLAYIIIMFCAGIGIPLMAAMNARMGRLIGSPSASAMVLFAAAFVIATLVTAATSGFAPLKALDTAPAYLFIGGLLIAFYLLSISWIAPRFGLGNAIFCVLIGQLAASTAIDLFGLFGAAQKPLSFYGLAGLAFMAVGVTLSVFR